MSSDFNKHFYSFVDIVDTLENGVNKTKMYSLSMDKCYFYSFVDIVDDVDLDNNTTFSLFKIKYVYFMGISKYLDNIVNIVNKSEKKHSFYLWNLDSILFVGSFLANVNIVNKGQHD